MAAVSPHGAGRAWPNACGAPAAVIEDVLEAIVPDISRPDGATIHYEQRGQGAPLLALHRALSEAAPAAADALDAAALADGFALLAPSQRCSGASTGPLGPFSYDAAVADTLAVLAAAGVQRTLLFATGGGCALALRLLRDAPARFTAAVLHEPVGLDGTNTLGDFYAAFNETVRLARAGGMAAVVAAAERQPDFVANPGAGPFANSVPRDPALREALLKLPVETYATVMVRFRDGLWPPEPPFFSVSAEWLKTCETPLLVLPGDDRLHPPAIARLIGETAPKARCLDAAWRQPAHHAETLATLHAFLTEHAPA